MITVAGTGFEPVSLGYEPIKEALLQPAVENVRLELLLCSPEAACKPLHFVLVKVEVTGVRICFPSENYAVSLRETYT